MINNALGGGSEVKASACNAGDPEFDQTQDLMKIPWRRKQQPPPIFLPGEFHRRRTLWDTVHRVTKSWTPLSDFTH